MVLMEDFLLSLEFQMHRIREQFNVVRKIEIKIHHVMKCLKERRHHKYIFGLQ